jgi:hypothetical protein
LKGEGLYLRLGVLGVFSGIAAYLAPDSLMGAVVFSLLIGLVMAVVVYFP